VLKATRASGPGGGLDLVSAEPGLAARCRRGPGPAALPNSTMTAFCWLRMDGVGRQSIRTRAMSGTAAACARLDRHVGDRPDVSLA
jgi:hypothetical protein